jgi:hypothetical protein
VTAVASGMEKSANVTQDRSFDSLVRCVYPDVAVFRFASLESRFFFETSVRLHPIPLKRRDHFIWTIFESRLYY